MRLIMVVMVGVGGGDIDSGLVVERPKLRTQRTQVDLERKVYMRCADGCHGLRWV
jgi:hypothetical protein